MAVPRSARSGGPRPRRPPQPGAPFPQEVSPRRTTRPAPRIADPCTFAHSTSSGRHHQIRPTAAGRRSPGAIRDRRKRIGLWLGPHLDGDRERPHDQRQHPDDAFGARPEPAGGEDRAEDADVTSAALTTPTSATPPARWSSYIDSWASHCWSIQRRPWANTVSVAWWGIPCSAISRPATRASQVSCTMSCPRSPSSAAASATSAIAISSSASRPPSRARRALTADARKRGASSAAPRCRWGS